MAATAVSMKTTTPFAEVASALRTWSGPAWLTSARHAAAARFEKVGLPTTRIEEWRTTPLPELPAKAYFPGFASTANRAQSLVAPFLADGAPAIVFVDGFHSVTLSSAETELPAGLRMTPVSTLLAMKPDVIQPWMKGIDDDSSGALHDLNTAAFRDGASVIVDDGASIDRELRVIVVATSTDQPVAQHLRHLVHLGRNSRVRMTLVVVGVPDARGFINTHLSLSMAEDAQLHLTRVHEAPTNVPHFDAFRATLGARAVLNDTLLQTGSAWTRSEIDVVLAGDHASADLGGVFLAQGNQVSDIHTVLSHEAPGVTSRQNYRGIAADEARGVFHGQIRVEPEARGTDATQNNKNLLLSRRALVHSTPALEILTDDVKCKHGSATGQIDPAQLFYLRSRGIDLAEATRVLTRAFAGEILSRITQAATRDLVERQIGPSLERLEAAA